MTDWTVLIVEDEQQLGDMYATVLENHYDVITTYSGEDALDAIDGSIDAVFLDRKMPGLSGHEVFELIRERGYDCPVTMVTAVEPDWDILDIGFDDYLLKPVDAPELRRAVKRLRALAAVDDEVREYVTRSIKEAALEGQKDANELAAHEGFRSLSSETVDISSQLGDVTTDFSHEEMELIIETITRNMNAGSKPEGATEFK